MKRLLLRSFRRGLKTTADEMTARPWPDNTKRSAVECADRATCQCVNLRFSPAEPVVRRSLLRALR